MLDIEKFRVKLQSFNASYISDFDGFWRWKLSIETGKGHILNATHRGEACRKLWSILREWQAYRPFNSTACLRILKDSLETISDAYNEIRTYSLLQFDGLPAKPLELIWHELGRVKEEGGNKNDHGYYYIVSLSKHLMFLWGQTLAFDSKVRKHIPSSCGIPRDFRWNFEDWKRVMQQFKEDLKPRSEIVDAFNKESLKRYGTNSLVPYGRFLDIYYH